ncbi:hypothetical protein LTR42_005926 [Elasticomyces elasticus]|nr:hypothetical protein LTR42_005926 [Elasticomyces elasticus]
MATAKLRTPTLAFAALSICLNLAIIGCAGRTLSFYNTEQRSNAWLLPIWPNHFDTRELHALVGTATAIVVLNAVLVAALFVRILPANIIVFAASLLSTICSLVAVIFPTLLNQHAPTRDTLQTWTCRWSNTSIDRGRGPSGFDALCHETIFLLGMAVYTVAAGNNTQPSRIMSDTEKSVSQHELGQIRAQSFETKSESPRSQQEAQMDAKKGVQFA